MKIFSPSKTVVIHNPVSGRCRTQRHAAVLLQYLTSKGYRVRQTMFPGQASEFAASLCSEGGEAVLCVGGDGTLSEILATLPENVPVGFFPAGTINLLAMNLSIPQDAHKWLAMLEREALKPIYLGVANNRRFVNIASIGFDAHVVAKVSPWLKSWLHRGAYLLQALYEYPRYQTSQLAVHLNGVRTHGDIMGILVARGRYYAGRFAIWPDADLSVPSLRVLLLYGSHKRVLWSHGHKLILGTLLQSDTVRDVMAQEIAVSTNVPTSVELDGDPYGLTPVHFAIDPRARMVLVP